MDQQHRQHTMDVVEGTEATSNVEFSRGLKNTNGATCRGKLQSKRCVLNLEINKELRMRAGAENLYKATTNRKLKETVALELSFVNSNLQLLKKQLSELNSSVEVYQNKSDDLLIPMIPLGLKETKEVNFMESFSDFILEHYSEEPTIYEDAIAEISDTRQAARTPSRDNLGVALLFRYYNMLYYVDRRFFPHDRSLGVYFEWYDSLTGVPSCQRTVAFEKACVLFNLGAIYTQIGTKHDRHSGAGLDLAVASYLRAAGIFSYIFDTFTNAPSMDLKPQVLEVLILLMLAQARECLYEKLQLELDTDDNKDKGDLYRDLSGEAAQLNHEFDEIYKSIQSNDTQSYLPELWAGLVRLKVEYYKGVAHYNYAKGIDGKHRPNNVRDKRASSVEEAFIDPAFEEMLEHPVPVKMAHIREAIACFEEAQRFQRMNRDLKNKICLAKALHSALANAVDESRIIEESNQEKSMDGNFDLLEVTVDACTKFTPSLTVPDFTSHKVEDPFKKLGPIAIFSARRHWTAPRSIRLQKGSTINVNTCKCRSRYDKDTNKSCDLCNKYTAYTGSKASQNQNKGGVDGYGFNIRGSAPVFVSNVEPNSLSYLGGIKDGDVIVEIAGIDVKWCSHQQVTEILKGQGSVLELKIITPLDASFLKAFPSKSRSVSPSAEGSSSKSSSSSPSATSSIPRQNKFTRNLLINLSSSSGSWNPFRRRNSLGKIF